jgi:DNA-binding transcriptional LysR family regulator
MMLKALQTFVAVQRDGTFSRAGERIGLTQSAISAQIKKLETNLEAELFIRGQRHAALTDAGRRLLPLAEQILGLVAALPAQIRQDSLGGRLRIGAIASVQTGLLPEALARYKARFPGLELHISPGVSAQLLDWIDSGQIDLALLIRPPFPLPRELHWQTLWREPFVLVVPESSAAGTVRELLTSQPFIRYDRNSYGGRLVQAFLMRQRIAVNDGMELDDLEAIVCMVERGLGVSLIPQASTLRLDGRRLRRLALGGDIFYREIGLASRRQQDADGICSGFAALLLGLATDDGNSLFAR